ncbi:MAG TPA: phosphate/phosphite/phosphonate ABC transporter substrate-binding protein [Gallionellaceae bacterium]
MKHTGLLLLLCLALPAHAAEPLKFGVANQRPVMLTAQVWNPILAYVSKKSGVPLVLAMGKTATETTDLAASAQLDFVYTNTLFTPQRDKIGFHAIARFNSPPIRGQIIVPEQSPIHQLSELDGKKLAVPTRESFISYALQMHALKRAGAKVETVFTGSQEGGFAQMANQRVDAAVGNSKIIESYAAREGMRYRAIFTSAAYPDLPIMAHPRVARSTVEKVLAALLGMSHDPEGRRILDDANAILMAEQPLAFVRAKDRDYADYRRFYLNAEGHQQP